MLFLSLFFVCHLLLIQFKPYLHTVLLEKTFLNDLFHQPFRIILHPLTLTLFIRKYLLHYYHIINIIMKSFSSYNLTINTYTK